MRERKSMKDVKTSKNTYYFSHDYNARNDEKILMLRATHGLEGYGVYWALAEMMYESATGRLRYDKLAGMAFGLGIDVKALKEVVDTCVNEGLFTKEHNLIWSEAVEKRKEKLDKIRKIRAEVGRLGGLASNSQANGKQMVSKPKQRKEKGKEKKVKDIEEPPEFEPLWKTYPRREGRKDALKHFKATVKTTEDLANIKLAVKNYADYITKAGKDREFTKMGSTFFNDWEEWVVSPADEEEKKKRLEYNRTD